MSFRDVDPGLVALIRKLQDEIADLRASVGAVRQNSIRLGDWVLEAIDDEKVRMTNLVTGVETFVGWATCDGVE